MAKELEMAQRERTYITQYRRQLKNYIMTSRFNDSTWTENTIFRKRNGKHGCVYCAPIIVSQLIPYDSVMFVMEMNNDTNKIMGIGMVRNHPTQNKYNVYQNNNFNRYTYTGKYRIDRNSMTEEENIIMRAFDIMCFTGNQHMKRGQGLTAFPIESLCRCAYNKMDLVDFITNMFKTRITTQEI
jgi:hypothetical protein